ncbi:SirB2 family protein [Dokdonella sp.]|uniref:SirB2 family protein n=1 Tax=Dokdonella sp. TaxID=2291710 RepID=UPI0031BF2E82|nr:SirB2 family protein [Dokdonella sp.]
MAIYYLEIKWVHIWAVILSGSLFAFRGLLMLARSRFTNHAALRFPSYVIDTTLLTAAFMLLGILHLNPFAQAWLTVKIVLLVVYIFLGVLALKRGRTRAVQVTCYFAALLVYLYIVSVARAHNPWGVFAPLMG